MQRAQWMKTRSRRTAHYVTGHRRLDDWRAMIDKADDSPVFGFLALTLGVLWLVFAVAVAGAMME